jgi:hypothetical protein
MQVTQAGQPNEPAQVLGRRDYFQLVEVTRLRNEATGLRNREEFQQLTELASTGFEVWAKESFEIATKIAYRNGGRIGIPRGGSMDCTMVAAAPVLLWTMLLVRAGLLTEG